MSCGKIARYIAVSMWVLTVFSTAFLQGGCQRKAQPRMRLGAFFGSPIGMEFPDPAKLGEHNFDSGRGEKNGMVYTCRAGFIDIGHLREAADRTAYVSDLIYRNLMLGNRTISFRLIEPSLYRVILKYPKGWRDQTVEERKKAAKELSIDLGRYIAHTSLIWHEIVTWYGFATAGIFPDQISSFSWEDPYSDLLGTCLAAEALRDDQQNFDEVMTALIDRTLSELDVQESAVAYQAAKKVEGQWFTGGMYFFVNMKKRNFDVGLDDGRITPLLVPEICPDAEPKLQRAPGPEVLSEYGFKIEIEIRPRIWETGRIYDSIGLDRGKRIKPHIHFPRIMKQIEKMYDKSNSSNIEKSGKQNAKKSTEE